MEKVGTAGGAIEAALFQQVGSDPNQPNAERDAQIGAIAEIIATFVQAASATLDVAIYDFRLSGAAANRVRSALNERAVAGVNIRILFDSATASGQNEEQIGTAH